MAADRMFYTLPGCGNAGFPYTEWLRRRFRLRLRYDGGGNGRRRRGKHPPGKLGRWRREMRTGRTEGVLDADQDQRRPECYAKQDDNSNFHGLGTELFQRQLPHRTPTHRPFPPRRISEKHPARNSPDQKALISTAFNAPQRRLFCPPRRQSDERLSDIAPGLPNAAADGVAHVGEAVAR